MTPRWWWLGAPGVVIALAASFVVFYDQVQPYPHGRLPIGVTASQPARVGQTVFLDLPIGTTRRGAHITGVHANDVSPGLHLKFASTTFARTGGNQLAGFPLSCAAPASVSPVAGTTLRPSTYLRLYMTPSKLGRLHFRSITVDWKDGPAHGSATGPFNYTLRTTAGHRLPC